MHAPEISYEKTKKTFSDWIVLAATITEQFFSPRRYREQFLQMVRTRRDRK